MAAACGQGELAALGDEVGDGLGVAGREAAVVGNERVVKVGCQQDAGEFSHQRSSFYPAFLWR